MRILVQGLLGLLFGLGLILSGLSDPSRVLGFLDVAAIPTGGWDPSFILVFLGAVSTALLGYRLVLRWPRPLLDSRFHLPSHTAIDVPVVVGPAIFGLGWGLAGLCPGPAFTALGTGRLDAALFVAAMLAGMGGARLLILSGRAKRPTYGPRLLRRTGPPLEGNEEPARCA